MGRMTIGYGELEIHFVSCAGYAFGNLDFVLRTSYAIKGEANRVKLANTMAGASYRELGLGNEYSDIYGIVKFCKQVRNQFAHSQFGDGEDGEVIFANIDDDATFSGGRFTPQWKKLTRELLREQEAYFRYAREFLLWIEGEVRNRRDRAAGNKRPYPSLHKKPARTQRPLLHTDL